MLAVLSFFFF